MNKNEFIDEVKTQSGLTKRDCRLCLDAMIMVISEALKLGESVMLSNFGKFKVNETKSNSLYNFKTKTTELVKAKRLPSFKASESLKQKIK